MQPTEPGLNRELDNAQHNKFETTDKANMRLGTNVNFCNMLKLVPISSAMSAENIDMIFPRISQVWVTESYKL